MTTPARRKQIAEAAARLKAKRREAGLVRLEIWAHPKNHAAIRALAKKLEEVET
jgi:hypothetical protein